MKVPFTGMYFIGRTALWWREPGGGANRVAVRTRWWLEPGGGANRVMPEPGGAPGSAFADEPLPERGDARFELRDRRLGHLGTT
ncbi:hypothetical protein GCM10010401_00540 [Rarobacter faecitabidus]